MFKERILGYPVVAMEKAQCLQTIVAWLMQGDANRTLFCANPHSLVLAQDDYLFSEALLAADMVIPDGTGIVLASKINGGAIRERVTGSDIFGNLSEELNRKGGFSYFFLGSTPQTLEAIRLKLARDFPHIIFAGSYSPPFTPCFTEKENRYMVDAINSASPDVVWVGMTAPKQEKWIYQNIDQLNVRFIGAVGAVFDFYAGKVKRAPRLFQVYGLEWLPRLLQQPSRLWRRTFISGPKFLFQVIMASIKTGRIGDSQF